MIEKDEFSDITDSILKPLDITIKAGIMDNDELVEIATYNNYGTEHIPARPFIGKALKSLDFNKFADSYLNNTGKLNDEIQAIGHNMKKNIRKSILNREFVDNAPSTIAKKGFNFPLVETGNMYDKVNYKIVDNYNTENKGE